MPINSTIAITSKLSNVPEHFKLVCVLERISVSSTTICREAYDPVFEVVFLFQMLFLATFFPTWEGGAGVYDFVGVSIPQVASFFCHIVIVKEQYVSF